MSHAIFATDSGQAHSPPCKGGVAAASIRSREATEEPQTGWSVRRKSSGLNIFAELLLRLRPIGLALRANPSAPFSERIRFISGASSPPCKGGECTTLEQKFHAQLYTTWPSMLIIVGRRGRPN